MPTYRQIQDYIRNKYGYIVKTCWIADTKEKCGLPVNVAPNRQSVSQRINQVPTDKIDAIIDAFKHFGMLK